MSHSTSTVCHINPDACKPVQTVQGSHPVLTVQISDRSKIEIKLMDGDTNLDLRRFVTNDPGSNNWLPTNKGIRVPREYLDDLISKLQELKAAIS